MPHPKRRSCIRCVQAKRRCNLGLPQCQRCEEKGVVCCYNTESTLTSFRTSPARSNTIIEQASPPMCVSEITLPALLDSLERENDMAMEFTPIPGVESSIDWLADMDVLPPLEFDDLVGRESVGDLIEKEAGTKKWEIYRPRVTYAVSRMKRWPAIFAQTSSTPFIHRSFFARIGGGPLGDDYAGRYGASEDIMLDALSACALYASKTVENRGAVTQDVRRKVKNLIEGRRDGPEQLLASTQALLLYQIIRLFDGDIGLRAEAEADEAVRKRWSTELSKYLRPLNGTTYMQGDVGVGVGVSRPLDWRNWVFDESVRRTILTSYMIQGNYEFLKEGVDGDCGPSRDISFTAQRAIWEAPSEYYWRVLWIEKPLNEISYSSWDSDAIGLNANDADDIGVILMAVLKDLDGTAEWLGKENLARFGMDWESMSKYLA